jgi:serine protease AprX
MMATMAATAKRRAYIFLDGAQPRNVLALLGGGANASVFKDYVEAQVDDATIAALKAAGREVYCAPAPPRPVDTPPAPQAPALAADAGAAEASRASVAAEPPQPIARISKRNSPRLRARFGQLKQHAPSGAPCHRLRVRLNGSLTQARRQELIWAGATIDSLRGGYYQVKASPAAQPAIKALPFVAEVRDYDLLDTVTTDLLQELAENPTGRGTFDAQAHSADEADRMAASIRAIDDVEILSQTKTTVRFTAPFDDKTLAKIGIIPEVMVLNPVRSAKLFLDRVRRLVGAEPAAKAPPVGLGLTGKGEKIAVIDSGIMTAHPDYW